MKDITLSSCRGLINLPLGSKQLTGTLFPTGLWFSHWLWSPSQQSPERTSGKPQYFSRLHVTVQHLLGYLYGAVKLSLLQTATTQPMSPSYMSTIQAHLQCLRGEQHKRSSHDFWLSGQFISEHEEEDGIPDIYRIKSKKGRSFPKSISYLFSSECNTTAVLSTPLLMNITWWSCWSVASAEVTQSLWAEKHNWHCRVSVDWPTGPVSPHFANT